MASAWTRNDPPQNPVENIRKAWVKFVRNTNLLFVYDTIFNLEYELKHVDMLKSVIIYTNVDLQNKPPIFF